MKQWWGHYRATVGFVILAVGMTFALFLLRQEAKARQAFDDRHDYEICLAGNERIEEINERFDRLDQILVSFGDPNDPRSVEFLAAEKAARLESRECVLAPQNSAGPQR